MRSARAALGIVSVVLCSLAAPLPANALQLWDDSSGGASFVETADGRPFADDRYTYLRDASGAEYEVVRMTGVDIACRPSPAHEWRTVGANPMTPNGPSAPAGIIGDRLVVIMAAPAAGWEAYIWSLRCADAWPEAPEVRVQALSPRPMIAWPAGFDTMSSLGFHSQSGVMDIEGRACVAGHLGIWCYDFDDPDAGVTLEVDAAVELPGLVADGAGAEGFLRGLWTEYFGEHIEPTVGWGISAARGLPDGSVALTAGLGLSKSHQNNGGTSGPFSIRYLLIRAPDGQWETRFEGPPHLYPGTTHDFAVIQFKNVFEGSEIHYDAAWDALWVGPTLNWQSYGLGATTFGSGGLGFGYRIFPMAGGPSGYLDLTEAWDALGACYSPNKGGFCGVYSSAGGLALFADDLRFRLAIGGAYDYDLEHADREAVDLDGDSLSRAEEAALGTSDFAPDSDGDGTLDGVEVWLGADPLTPDSATAALPPTVFIPSPLLADYLLADYRVKSAITGDNLGLATSPGRLNAAGPLCRLVDAKATGECIDDQLNVVATWQQDLIVGPQVSWDGHLVVYRNQESIGVVDMRTGEDRVWVDKATLDAAFGDQFAGVWFAGQLWPYAIDADNLWLTNITGSFSTTTRVVHVDRAGNAKIVYDLNDDACVVNDLKTLRCDEPDRRGQEVFLAGRSQHNANGQIVVGYHEESERLLIGLAGTPESYLVGLHPTQAPVEVMRSGALEGNWREDYARSFDVSWGAIFPSFLTRLSDGTYHADDGLRGPRLERVEVTGWAPWVLPGSGLLFQGFWGDTVVDQTGVEWVRYEQRVSPGDTLFLARDTVLGQLKVPGYMLYAIGPRGGLNPLWRDPNDELQGVTGMALSAAGALCVADRVGQRMVVLEPSSQDTKIPDTERLRVEGLDVVDCHYTADDTLLLLADGPPRLLSVAADGTTSEVEALTTAGQVAEIVTTADGGYEVFSLTDGDLVRGYVYDRDGVRVEFRNGEALDYFGEPIVLEGATMVRAVYRPDLWLIQTFASISAAAMPEDTDFTGWVPHVVRPSGAASQVGYLGVHSPHHALAQVPGGDGLNPWSGVDERPPPGTGNPGADAGGSDTSAGVGGGSDGSGGDAGDPGCASAAPALPRLGSWTMVLLVLVVVRRRRT